MAIAKLSRDPYKTFRFLVKFDGEIAAGVSSVGGLTQSTEAIEYRHGNDPLKKKFAPGQTKYEAVTLERGITINTEFHDWAQKLFPDDSTGVDYEDDFRKDLDIVLCDENGNEAVTFKLKDCWISDYKSVPDLDAGENSIAIESIKIEHEGWAQEDWLIQKGARGSGEE